MTIIWAILVWVLIGMVFNFGLGAVLAMKAKKKSIDDYYVLDQSADEFISDLQEIPNELNNFSDIVVFGIGVLYGFIAWPIWSYNAIKTFTQTEKIYEKD